MGKKEGNETTAVDTNEDYINQRVEQLQVMPIFSDCDKDDARMWLEHNDSGFQFLDDVEILSFVQEGSQIHVVTDDEDSSDAYI